MKKLKFLALCLILLAAACSPQAVPESGEKRTGEHESRIKQYLINLTAGEMAGRRAGTRGEARAALYTARIMQKAGLRPAGDRGTYFQGFLLGGYEPVLVDKRMTFRSNAGPALIAENILGLLPGKEPGIIVVGAHLDHLGIIEGKTYPGANDNASGTAAILELINSLQGEKPHCSILFALWSGEEMGLLGSSFFCENPTLPLTDIKAVINLDSIGNLHLDKTLLSWSSLENDTSRAFMEVLTQEGWQIIPEKTEKHSSDHVPFNKKGIGGFTILSRTWLDKNHTPGDTVENVRIEYLESLAAAIKKALLT